MPEMHNHWRTSSKVFKNAKDLSRNMTDAETALWQALRSHQIDGVHFRRQHAIGPYVTDFCSPRKKVIIEVDGGQHLEQEEYDVRRTMFLESLGYKVLRFWNDEVLTDMDLVLERIMFEIEDREH